MANEPRRTQAQQERRIRILETAMRMAGEGGYEAVQMRAVAEESGVALGTIYRYYLAARTRCSSPASPAGCDAPVAVRRSVRLPATRRATDSSSCSSVPLRLPKPPTLMGALIRALGTTSPAAIEHKLEVDTQFRALVVTALGPDRGLDAEGIARVIGHVVLGALPLGQRHRSRRERAGRAHPCCENACRSSARCDHRFVVAATG